jgi:hypothetical protein
MMLSHRLYLRLGDDHDHVKYRIVICGGTTTCMRYDAGTTTCMRDLVFWNLSTVLSDNHVPSNRS